MVNGHRFRLILLLCLLMGMAGVLAVVVHPIAAAAQAGGLAPTPTAAEVIPRQDIPGDTTLLLIAAGGLIFIAVGAIVWRSRKD